MHNFTTDWLNLIINSITHKTRFINWQSLQEDKAHNINALEITAKQETLAWQLTKRHDKQNATKTNWEHVKTQIVTDRTSTDNMTCDNHDDPTKWCVGRMLKYRCRWWGWYTDIQTGTGSDITPHADRETNKGWVVTGSAGWMWRDVANKWKLLFWDSDQCHQASSPTMFVMFAFDSQVNLEIVALATDLLMWAASVPVKCTWLSFTFIGRSILLK